MPNWVSPSPELINQTSFSINQTSFSINQTSFSINQTSFSINQTSFSINRINPVEQLEVDIVDLLAKKKHRHKENLVRSKIVNDKLDKIKLISKKLSKLYQSNDRKAEINKISGSNFNEFYSRLKALKDSHRRDQHVPIPASNSTNFISIAHNDYTQDSLEVKEYMDNLYSLFSGEESFGRFLDFNSLFLAYLNLPNFEKKPISTYLEFVRSCEKSFETIPKATKSTSEYVKYLTDFKTYLESFLVKSQPLYDLDSFKVQIGLEFSEAWVSGSLVGYETAHTDFNPDLFCVPCQKQFTNPTIFESHKPGKKHTKALTRFTATTDTTPTTPDSPLKPLAFTEFLIKSLLLELSPQLKETHNRVEAKSMLTDEERSQLYAMESDDEIEEVVAPTSDTSSETGVDDSKIYNPLKLPLGWDGKPIPYWLYKLHGLGVEYPCEICGGFIYLGRKIFDRHFSEWRHNNGLRSLGIGNSRSFIGVVAIQDAFDLWETLRIKSGVEDVKMDVIEEFEDKDGNVFNKKTFDDLKRQGLL